ncbi:MAG: T9SS type A sorting domain-containing protein [Muribaculaceae bacterium]|nr:T9SS type A sorting domain-containing protein [Muribaculaceae bacterium]
MLSKKLTTTLLSLSMTVAAFAEGGDQAQITTVPSPAISTKALEVKITTSDFGSEVYCYTWCEEVNGESKTPTWGWDDVHNAKFKMTGSNGSYSFKIDNIKDFYGLSDAEIEGLTKLGFIAKTSSGRQTIDLIVNVEQGPREAYGGGYGTQASPYILSTKEHLVSFADNSRDWGADVYVKLGADLDGSVLNSPIGTSSTPYQGHFDGAGHTITDVILESSTLGNPIGLFGVLRGGEIKSLGVKEAFIKGINNVGILVGTAESGVIERCFVVGDVIGKSICIGGLVGENINATISDCYAGGTVLNSDDYATGGFVGKNSGTIKNVYATCGIMGKDYVGGVVGANYGVIRNSLALNSEIIGEHEYTARFGGNGNARNQSSSNHSWDLIAKETTEWHPHGDHASAHPAYDLIDFTKFQSFTGWDFTNIWEWKTDGEYPVPLLRNVNNQRNVIPQSFYAVSAVEEIFAADKVSISVGPNPFTDYITVRCSEPLQSVDVYSISGTRAAVVNCNGACEVEVDMSGVSAGLYVLTAISQSGSKSTFKVIKK